MTKRKRPPYPAIAATSLLALGAAASLADTITLKREAQVGSEADVIRLADIADLDGEAAEALADAVILDHVGSASRLSVQDVRRALEKADVNLACVALSGNRVQIHRDSGIEASAPVKPESNPAMQSPRQVIFASELEHEPTVKGMIAREISRDLLQRDLADIELGFDRADRAVLDRIIARLAVEILPQGTVRAPQLPLVINVYHDQRLVDSHRIVVTLRVREHLVVATRYIRRGERLKAEDFREEIRLVAPHPSPAVESIDELAGLDAAGRIVEGQIMRRGDFESPVLVRRNEEITVRVQAGLFIIRMRARALSDGREGEVIRVQRLGDRVELTGQVDGNGEVVAVRPETMEGSR